MSFNVISNDFPNDRQTLLDFTRKYFPDANIAKFNFRTYEKHTYCLYFWKYVADFGSDLFKSPDATVDVYCTDDFLGTDEGDEIYYDELKFSELLEFIKNAKKEYDNDKEVLSLTGKKWKVIEGDKKDNE